MGLQSVHAFLSWCLGVLLGCAYKGISTLGGSCMLRVRNTRCRSLAQSCLHVTAHRPRSLQRAVSCALLAVARTPLCFHLSLLQPHAGSAPLAWTRSRRTGAEPDHPGFPALHKLQTPGQPPYGRAAWPGGKQLTTCLGRGLKSAQRGAGRVLSLGVLFGPWAAQIRSPSSKARRGDRATWREMLYGSPLHGRALTSPG